jgi:hypothetical protein
MGSFPVEIADQTVSVELAEGLADPSAPRGGMLYNLKRGKEAPAPAPAAR